MKAYMLVLVAAALVPAAFLQPAYAEGMVQTSSGGSLDVMVEPQWGEDAQTQIRVSFLDPSNDTVHPHIDYDLKISDSAGNQVFSQAGQLNQPTLHTNTGAVTIPYTFEENGSYIITVDVTGILFTPIALETAEFSVNVTPEFPTGALSVIAAVTAGTIAVARMRKF